MQPVAESPTTAIHTPRSWTTASTLCADCGVAADASWRITVEDDLGRRALKGVPLKAATVAEAQEEMRTVLVERSEDRLRHVGKTPKFADYLGKTYLPGLDSSGKKPGTLVTEKGHLDRWKDAIGHLDLDKIRPTTSPRIFASRQAVFAHIHGLMNQGWSVQFEQDFSGVSIPNLDGTDALGSYVVRAKACCASRLTMWSPLPAGKEKTSSAVAAAKTDTALLR